MRLIQKIFLVGTLLFGAGSAAAVLNAPKDTQVVEAAQEYTHPKNGYSGTVLYVSGAGFFPKDQCNVAICCWNNTEYAWSEASNYCCYGNLLRTVLPYKDGVSKTWTKVKICRYELNKDPRVYEDSCVIASTDPIDLTSMLYNQNTITITGIDGNHLYVSNMYNANYYYGIKSEEHIYLDLSSFKTWENDGAKFAFYFSNPISNTGEGWGLANTSGDYYSSFCWKVNGQDNEHLYECIVPKLYNNTTIWNLVIAVRMSSTANTPSWDAKWNQSQDLHFDSSNHNANMIRVTNWGTAELDATNSISKVTRMSFFGQYFLDTVKCSGNGDSDATTNDMWNTLKYEYETHLADDYQGDFWTAEADEEGTLLEQAAARYDYIVFYKQYAHEDFVNRAESPNKSSRYLDAYNAEFDSMPSILIVVISISIASVALILLIKAKHRRYKNY